MAYLKVCYVKDGINGRITLETTVTDDVLSKYSFQFLKRCTSTWPCVCTSSSLAQEMEDKVAQKNLSDTITIF